MKLGVIADDFTGATDIAGFLVEYGISTVQINGVPAPEFNVPAEAYVISLKSRSCAVEQAVEQARRSLDWLRGMKCDRFYFKYCSTFDSTEKGNIGPVADAMLESLESECTVVCPALPVNGRTVYKGYLFVHDQLLNESGMKDHPLNPMKDAKIARLLAAQTEGSVAEVHAEVVDQGTAAVRHRILNCLQAVYRYIVLDTLKDEHLAVIAEAVKDMPLLTGGSGLALGLSRLQNKGALEIAEAKRQGRPSGGKTVILSGSCSEATRKQVAAYRRGAPSLQLDGDRCLEDKGYVEELFQWAAERSGEGTAPMLYSTTDRIRGDARKIGAAIEEVFGRLAARLAEGVVKNFIVAGGETSGRVVQSLGVRAFWIGPQVSPGVPWVKSVGGEAAFILKSGNFGDEDFFARAQGFYGEEEQQQQG